MTKGPLRAPSLLSHADDLAQEARRFRSQTKARITMTAAIARRPAEASISGTE